MSLDPIQELLAEVVGSDLVTQYIIVLEVMTGEGMDLRVATSDTLTAWHAAGMLQASSDIITAGHYMERIEEDDE